MEKIRKNSNKNSAEIRIVAYIDILGYKNFVNEWLVDDDLAIKIESTLTKAIEWVGGEKALLRSKENDWKVKFFSDSIIISVQNNALGILNIVQGLSSFQRQMIDSGFLIRGAITIGKHLESKLSLLSQALVEAYELESHLAVFPRILISNKLLEEIEKIEDDEFRKEIREYIIIDNNKTCFLCYLIFEEDDPWFTGEKFYEDHKKIIEKALTNPNYSVIVKKKYSWLALFHNWCLRTTTERLKKGGVLDQDNVWNFTDLIIKEIPYKNKITFNSMLWIDKSFKRSDFNNFYFIDDEYYSNCRNIDWIKEWPDVSSEDDEEEPDMEEENYD